MIDFAGSDPQVKGPINAPLSVTASGVFCGLKMAVDPNSLIPPNSGCWRTIEVKAPKGSVVNAAFPAPVVYANHEISHRVADMVMGALASIWPDRVMACSQGTSAILTLGGVDPRSGRRYVSYETVKGGFGARPTKDGINVVAIRHLQHHEHAGRGAGDGLPGAHRALRDQRRLGRRGAYRGGCGARRTWRLTEGADAIGSLCMERMTSPPFGLLGGKAGAAAVVTLTTPDGVTRHLPSKGAFLAPAGSVVDMITPGSGGFGAPAKRARAAIGRDLADGYVSRAGRARRLRRRRPRRSARRRRQGRRRIMPLWIRIDRRCQIRDVIPAKAGTHATIRTCVDRCRGCPPSRA